MAARAKDIPRGEAFTIRRVIVVEGDPHTAEMLHTFLRLMDLEPVLIPPASASVPTIGRSRPDVVVLDLDAPDLRAVDLAFELVDEMPQLAVIFLTADASRVGGRVVEKPATFEELLAVFEEMIDFV